MREQLQQRLAVLRAETQKGQALRAEWEAKLADLNATLLRISGAIQVIEEALAEHPKAKADPSLRDSAGPDPESGGPS